MSVLCTRLLCLFSPPQSGGGTVGLQGGVVPPAYQSGNSAGGFQGGNTAGGFQSGNSAGGFQGGNSAGGFQGGNSAAGFQGGNSAGGFTGGNFSGGFSNGNGSSPPQAPAFPGQQHGNQEAFSNLKNDLNQGFDDAMLAAGVNPVPRLDYLRLMNSSNLGSAKTGVMGFCSGANDFPGRTDLAQIPVLYQNYTCCTYHS